MSLKTVIFIDKIKFELSDPVQTGRSLKALAGIALTDVLFLKQPHEDPVIANDTTITLKDGSHLYVQPAADYGQVVDGASLGTAGSFRVVQQADGWRFVIIETYTIPPPFLPATVRLLIKLPPLFPTAAPDMFWVQPPLSVNGAVPKGAGMETLLGEPWQRFSWHLKKGAWKPGISELRDFMRCIRGRFERQD
ncbi:MAG: hypothetical protein M9894_09785 [Planctomycetes bacterium]|nr:hypothetical protein [Planctomycetota bacterium]